MDNVTGNCTSTKANITVKAVFDGNQSGQQAFMKLIRRKYHTSGADTPNNDIDKTAYSIDKIQYIDDVGVKTINKFAPIPIVP